MAAYAALLTLKHTMEQIQHHPRPPISLDKNQVQSLTENITFLQKFLERHPHEAGCFESRIAEAAREAEDIIESHVVDRIFDGSTSDGEERFHERLEKMVGEMDLIKKDAMDAMKETSTPIHIHVQKDSTPLNSLRSTLMPHNTMVGFEDVLIEIMEKLTGEESGRQIIPIAGVDGIGKTTLARTVYSHTSIEQHFDVRAWATISQQYNTHEICVQLLSQLGKLGRGNLVEMSENDLKERIHKVLVGRRYLIVLDDIWSMEVWDEIQRFFPDLGNRSRVVITTRLSNLASRLVNGSYCLQMRLLDEIESWKLFCKVVFGEENCPLDNLKEIGKKIARGCKGLPLSLCVVGGLLSKSEDEIEYWEYVWRNLNTVVNLEDNEHCLKILHMSYIELPAHLKPCFLHVGVFPEDEKIRVSEIMELWIVKGILKPIDGKSVEVVGKEYFNELIERNLISVHSLCSIGTIKYCNTHDLLRDFCLRQALKQGFNNVLELENFKSPPTRVTDNLHVKDDWPLDKEYHDAFRSTQLATSLYFYSWKHPIRPNSRLLRIWTKCSDGFALRYGDSLHKMFLWKYYTAKPQGMANVLSSSIHPFWNLKTLIMYTWMVLMVPSQIWNFPHLRHVSVWEIELPDPPRGDHDIVLENLQTLSKVKNFKCSEEIIKMIPNIKKLGLVYTTTSSTTTTTLDDRDPFLYNIERLCKLESLSITCTVFWQKLTFPSSLKKLTIEGFSAEEVLGKIGDLPNLEKLRLIKGTFGEKEWVTVEGQFRSLKFLLVKECYELEYWETESFHFPHLEQLTLWGLEELEEIPPDIGDIPTLVSIHVNLCSASLVDSAKKIREEQEEQGNEGLQVRFNNRW